MVKEDCAKKLAAEVVALSKVSKTLTTSFNLDRMLALVTRQVARTMHCRLCMVHLMENGGLALKAASSKDGLLSSTGAALGLSGGIIGLVVKNSRPYRIKDLWQRKHDALYPVSRRYSFRSVFSVPLTEKGVTFGALTIIGSDKDNFSGEDEDELSLFSYQAAIAVENSRLFTRARESYINTMGLLAGIIDAKDHYTEDHSEEVVRLVMGIADKLKVDKKSKEILKHASFLHDIGKIGIDARILQKPDSLTREEWKKIREHPRIGADIIKKAGFLDDLIPTILYHHVWYGGGGYPASRKKGAEIPIGARVLAVADAYEAMTSDRPYRKRLSSEQALKELRRGAGTQFDPRVVKTLAKFICEDKKRAKKKYALWKD